MAGWGEPGWKSRVRPAARMFSYVSRWLVRSCIAASSRVPGVFAVSLSCLLGDPCVSPWLVRICIAAVSRVPRVFAWEDGGNQDGREQTSERMVCGTWCLHGMRGWMLPIAGLPTEGGAEVSRGKWQGLECVVGSSLCAVFLAPTVRSGARQTRWGLTGWVVLGAVCDEADQGIAGAVWGARPRYWGTGLGCSDFWGMLMAGVLSRIA